MNDRDWHRRNLRALTLGVWLTLAGCGPEGVEDLDEPVVWWRDQSNFCGTIRAVDGNRGVWADHGCEDDDDLASQGTASEAAYAEILKAAASLPAPPVLTEGCGGRKHLFGRLPDGQHNLWVACGTKGTQIGDLTGLAEPYLTLARALQAAP